VSGVNQYLCVALWLTACHVGRPPVTSTALALGQVRAPAAEPSLEDALRSGLGSALAARGLLDRKAEEQVNVWVRSATTRPVAVDGLQQVHTARLEISVEVTGAAPRSLVLSDELSYGVGRGGTLDASAARAAAFQGLAQRLSEEAASWIVYGPRQESP